MQRPTSVAQTTVSLTNIARGRAVEEIFDRLPEGIIAFDRDCRYIAWNAAMERITGVSRSDVLGRVAFDVFPFLKEIGEDKYFHAALRGESCQSQNRHFQVKSSSNRGVFDGDYSPLRDEVGNVAGGFAIIRDRTNDETMILETLLRTGEVVAAELDLERIVQAVTDAATKATGAQFGAFFYNVVNQKGESYMLYTLSGVPREEFSKFPMPRNTAVFAPTFLGEGIVRSDDITKDPRYGKNAPHYGQPKGHLPVRSYLAVPVQGRSGEVIGGLFFGHSEVGRFLPSSERIVDAMAKQAAVAIENARLYEQQKYARQEAEESQARATAIWNSISDAFVFFDSNWVFVYVNDKACELIGAPRGQLLGKNSREVFEAGELRTRLEGCIAEQRVGHFEEFFDPWKKWLECHCYPSKDGVALYLRDVTARRNAESALRKAEDRLRMVTESSEIGHWYCDLPFDELIWSDKTKEHFWLPPEARVTIQMFYDIIHPEDRERTRTAIERSLNTHGQYDIDYRTVSSNGRVKWIRAIGRGFYDEDGNPTRFDGFTIDMTERKLAEEALRRSEKLAAAGRLSATIAHEINNPLAAVMNLLFVARDSTNLNDIHNYLEVADQELKRVAHITKQTLGFYKDSNAPAELNAAEVVSDVLSIYKRRIETRNLEVECQFRDPEAKLIGNSGEVRQVISNLIANAIDSMTDPGRLVLRVSRASQGRAVRISVGDAGCGIPQSERDRLFEPFHTTKTDVGTGLGLWVSRQLVEKHSGSIRFRSCTVPGRSGTVFTVKFPAAALKTQ